MYKFNFFSKKQETQASDNGTGTTNYSYSSTGVDSGDNYGLSRPNHNRPLDRERFHYSGNPIASRYNGIQNTSRPGGSGTRRLPKLTEYRIPKKTNPGSSGQANLFRQVATVSKPKAKPKPTVDLDWNEIMMQAQVKNPKWFAYLSQEKTIANLEALENPYVSGCFRDKDELDNELERVHMATMSMKAEKSDKASFGKSLKPLPKLSSDQTSMFDIPVKKSNLEFVEDNTPIVIDVLDSQETQDLNLAKQLQNQEDLLASTSPRQSRPAKSKAMTALLSQISSDSSDFETNEDTMKPKRPRKSRMSIKVQDRACPSCGRKMPYERLIHHSTTCNGGYTNNNKFNALGQCSTCSRIVLPRERVHHVCEIFMPK